MTVIWHDFANAAVSPKVVSLGRLTAGISAPTRLAVDKAGTLYVSDPRKNAILRFDQYGTALAPLKGDYRISGSGVAVTADGSRVYAAIVTAVAANGARSVKGVGIIDTASGALLGYLGQGGNNEFQEAGEIELDAQGIVYVADTVARTIRVYNPTTNQFLYAFGGPGTTNGLFWTIRSISVDPTNQEVYVLDPSSNNGIVRVQAFSLTGTFKRLISQTSFGTPVVCYPGGITFDNYGRGYMVESFYSDMRIFQSGATFASFGIYGTFGYGAGQFSQPFDAVYDPSTKRLFVANDGARIEIFGIDGGTNPVQKNIAPGQPVALSPVSDSLVADAAPLLQWQAAIDPDGDALTYDLKIEQDGQTVQTLSKIGALSVKAAPLKENSRYSWSLQAADGQAVSGYTAAESFWVDAVQEAPSAPLLTAPLNAAVLDGNAVFSWGSAVDPDPFDSVGYRLQIAESVDFSTLVIETPVQSTTVSAPLKTLTGYAKLADGATYYWRALASDNDNLATGSAVRSFTYDTTLLTVDATFPGATVSLGGNHAYSGRVLGVTPLELRDLPALNTTLVIERAGFEPYLVPLVLNERDNRTIKADLVPATAPAGLKARPISAGNGRIQGNSDLVPLAVDYDRDGRIDLLAADAGGTLTYYRALDDQLTYAAGVKLPLVLPAGAAPVVVDWNNDNTPDLLVGSADGSVKLYNGFNTAATALLAAGAPLNVGAGAIPCVLDVDGDGKKDLIVGSGSGSVVLYSNNGSDEAPVFAGGQPLLPAISGNAAPFATDWNADGIKDLLVATSQHIFVYLRQADGRFAAQTVLSVEDDLTGKNGKASSGSGYLGDKLRLFVLDLDGKNGKDLIVGNAAGQLRLAASFGKESVPAFAAALQAKMEQIETLAATVALSAEAQATLAAIGSNLTDQRYSQAKEAIDGLIPTLGDPALTTALVELAGVL